MLQWQPPGKLSNCLLTPNTAISRLIACLDALILNCADTVSPQPSPSPSPFGHDQGPPQVVFSWCTGGQGPKSWMISLWQLHTSLMASGVPMPAARGSPAGPNQWFCGAPVVRARSPAYVVPLTVWPSTSCRKLTSFDTTAAVKWCDMLSHTSSTDLSWSSAQQHKGQGTRPCVVSTAHRTDFQLITNTPYDPRAAIKPHPVAPPESKPPPLLITPPASQQWAHQLCPPPLFSIFHSLVFFSFSSFFVFFPPLFLKWYPIQACTHLPTR